MVAQDCQRKRLYNNCSRMSLLPLLAIIPARSGSKGLPRKNLRPLAGLPLIAHSIKFAAMCQPIKRCIVSTDNEEIRDVAFFHGGDAPFLRPAELAADDTPMLPVLQHALKQVEQTEGRTYAGVLLLQPTSPVRSPAELDQALAIMEQDSSAVGVVAVAETPFNPAYVCVRSDSDYIAMAFGDERKSRHDFAPVLRITGSLYLWRRDYIASCSELRMAQERHRMLVIPKDRVFDIDDLNDFRLAELAVTSGMITLPWLSSVPVEASGREGAKV
jgi:N-acylneuraminate cytidylyltransferase